MKQLFSPCDLNLLQDSLSDQLTQQQEEQLACHLSHCQTCRLKLQELAGDRTSWQRVGDVLRLEASSGEHLRARTELDPTGNSLHPIDHAARADEDEFYDGPELKPSDFIVDFLKPSENANSIGRLGDIEIREFIGQGAHGIVLKGFQVELNRLVAVKVMAPHLASVVAARKRFAREARATAAIVHPNVMPVLQVDSSGPLPFLVMPYVDCETLQDRLDRGGFLPQLDILRIAVQIARGLSAAHAQGLVHRDVKPANILLERGVERVMLTDFGLARAVDDATLTRSGLIAGTPHYMSPEQARGEAIDARSDLFSLGSVLYAIGTGRPPFRAETTYGILRRVTDEQPRPAREINSELAPWFEAIVHKLLEKSPSQRFTSADQVASVFEDCLAHVLQPNAIALPVVVQRLLPKHRTPRIGMRIIVAVACLALVALGVGAFELQEWISKDDTENNSALQGRLEQDQVGPEKEPQSADWNDDLEERFRLLDTEIDKLLHDIELDSDSELIP